MDVPRNPPLVREDAQIRQRLWVNQWEWLVAYIWLWLWVMDHDQFRHISLTYFAADGVGDVRINSPVGSRVAVVSILATSRPWPTSVNINCPLKQIVSIFLTNIHIIIAYIFLNLSRSSMSRSKSGRPSENWMIVPAARLYWIVKRVVDAPSMQVIGSVCKSQNFWERVARSFLVMSGEDSYILYFKTETKNTDCRQARDF